MRLSNLHNHINMIDITPKDKKEILELVNKFNVLNVELEKVELQFKESLSAFESVKSEFETMKRKEDILLKKLTKKYKTKFNAELIIQILNA